jgi:hypothetical protein
VLNPELAVTANALAAMAAPSKKVSGMIDAQTDKDLEFENAEAAKGGKAAAFAVDQFMKDLTDAADRGDKATAEHMAMFIETHQNLLDSMHTAGIDITKSGEILAGIIDHLGDKVLDSAAMGGNRLLKAGGGAGTLGNHMIAEELRGIVDKQKKEATTKGAPVMDFRGSNFQIHQDFRDQDPDRIVAMMRQDLVQSANARTQSRVAIPRGM